MSNSYPPARPEEEPRQDDSQQPPSEFVPERPEESYYLPTNEEELIDSSEEADAGTNKNRGSAILKEVAETLILAILIFFTVRGAVQNFKVEGSSMEPSLHNNQYLLVNKLSYTSLDPGQMVDFVLRIPTAAAARLGLGEEEHEITPITTAPED